MGEAAFERSSCNTGMAGASSSMGWLLGIFIPSGKDLVSPVDQSVDADILVEICVMASLMLGQELSWQP